MSVRKVAVNITPTPVRMLPSRHCDSRMYYIICVHWMIVDISIGVDWERKRMNAKYDGATKMKDAYKIKCFCQSICRLQNINLTMDEWTAYVTFEMFQQHKTAARDCQCTAVAMVIFLIKILIEMIDLYVFFILSDPWWDFTLFFGLSSIHTIIIHQLVLLLTKTCSVYYSPYNYLFSHMLFWFRVCSFFFFAF